MKAFLRGMISGVSALAIVGGLLWVVFVSVLGLGTMGMVIAGIGGVVS